MKVTFLGVWMVPECGETVSFVIELDSGEKILVDTGMNTTKSLLSAGISPSDITHIIITHAHGDHMSGLPMYLFYRLNYLNLVSDGCRDAIKVIATKQTLEAAKEFIKIPYPLMSQSDKIQYVNIEIDNSLNYHVAGRYVFEFFITKHSPQTVGFKLSDRESKKSFVYSSDTSFDEGIFEAAQNSNFLIHDVAATSKFTMLSKGHSLCDTVAAASTKYGIKKLIPVHRLPIYQKNCTDYLKELQEGYAGEIVIPNDGDTLIV